MFYFLFPLVVGLVIALWIMSVRVPLGLKSLGVHPFNILGAFIAIAMLNFWSVHDALAGGDTTHMGGTSISTMEDFNAGFVFFLLYTTAMVLGVFLGMPRRPTTHVEIVEEHSQTAATYVFIVALGGALFVLYQVAHFSLSMGSLGYVAQTRTIFFRQHQLYSLMWAALSPSFLLLGSRRPLNRWTLIAGLVSIGVVMLFGERAVIIYLLMGLAFWVSQRRNWISVPLVYGTFPAIAVLLLFYRYFLRVGGSFTSFSQYLVTQGGFMSAAFGGSDITTAQSNIAFVAGEGIHRGPLDSLIAGLMAPLPRAFFHFKPYGASTQFTLERDTANWFHYTRELVIGGASDMYAGFGYFGAILILGLVGFVWARWLTRCRNAAFSGPVAAVFLYTFLRNDSYNTALWAWPLAATWVGYSLVLWWLNQVKLEQIRKRGRLAPLIARRRVG